jgi:hypothetical protein
VLAKISPDGMMVGMVARTLVRVDMTTDTVTANAKKEKWLQPIN